jgi:CubicO group peptidase (beta-lactamase class C family)
VRLPLCEAAGRRWALLGCAALALAVASLPALGQGRYPGKSWDRERGSRWSAEKLRAARVYSDTIKTAAVMIVQHGAVVDEWGETARKFNCHSIRKSLLGALYGIEAAAGRIDLKRTLGELGIDDNAPSLTPTEKRATVLDLLKARSGVYHPALYEATWMKALRPLRGSHPPGTFWYYNNWDFNALGTIFERQTETKLFEAFKNLVADPLEMQDYRLEDGEYFTGPDSVHPAYPFRMTARDLARFGLLFLRQGAWHSRQIVPREWVRESTKSHSDAGGGEGYGYLWWISRDSFSARGAGGHYVWVIPSMDLVVVHRVNTDEPGNEVTGEQFGRLLRLIVSAATSTTSSPSRHTPALSRESRQN